MVDKEDMVDSRVNLDKPDHWGVDIRANSAKQDHWEVEIRANLVKLELTGGTLLREEGSKLDIRANQLGTLVNQLDTPVNQLDTPASQQLTPANQLVILTSLLPILHNQEDILLLPMLAILVQGACHTQPSLLKGCLVCSTHQVLIPLDLHFKVATNNILLPVQLQLSHPQHLLSTLLWPLLHLPFPATHLHQRTMHQTIHQLGLEASFPYPIRSAVILGG